MLLITWADTFDSADGQLARLTQQYSRMGRILDGVSGDFWFAAIGFALVFRELDFGDSWTGPNYFAEHEWLIWALGIGSGLSHALQAAMADCYRQFHLFFLKGQQGSELESAAKLKEQYHQLEWGRNFWSKLPLFFYSGYTANQERMTPNMQRLRAALNERYGENGVPSQEFREYFRQLSLPLMKYTNILTHNTRATMLFIGCLANVPWIYPLFEVTVLVAIYYYMKGTHERMCKNMQKDRAKHNILPLSKFGLMQITRQRVRPVMDVVVDEECPVCHGKGKIKSSILFVDTLERKIEQLVNNVGMKRFTLYVHPYVYAYIAKGLWSIKRQWMWRYKWAVNVVPSQELAFLQYRFVDTQGEEIDMKDDIDVKRC
jgi:hypothetical protein